MPKARPTSERDRGGERHGGEVEADGRDPRHGGRKDGAQALERPRRHQQAEQSTGQRQHHALDQQLPDQPSARRPERGAHRQLTASAERPRQHQPGDVGAGDEQDGRDRGEEQQQRRARFPDDGVVDRFDVEATAAVAVGMTRGQRLGQHPELAHRLGRGNPGNEAGDDVHVAELALAEDVAVDLHRRRRHRSRRQPPELGALRKGEVTGHHPDDFVGLAVDAEGAADYLRIGAEVLPPGARRTGPRAPPRWRRWRP